MVSFIDEKLVLEKWFKFSELGDLVRLCNRVNQQFIGESNYKLQGHDYVDCSRGCHSEKQIVTAMLKAQLVDDLVSWLP